MAGALSQPTFAGCSPSQFSENGPYYSPIGDPSDALKRGRIKLPKIRGYKGKNYTALEAGNRLQYSSKGKFLLRAGANEGDYIVVLPSKNREAVLVRSISHSVRAKAANYASLTRSDLDFGTCDARNEDCQLGLGDEKYFYEPTSLCWRTRMNASCCVLRTWTNSSILFFREPAAATIQGG